MQCHDMGAYGRATHGGLQRKRNRCKAAEIYHHHLLDQRQCGNEPLHDGEDRINKMEVMVVWILE